MPMISSWSQTLVSPPMPALVFHQMASSEKELLSTPILKLPPPAWGPDLQCDSPHQLSMLLHKEACPPCPADPHFVVCHASPSYAVLY